MTAQLYVVKVDTSYCGTDNYIIFASIDDAEADSYAQELAYENACNFFEVVDGETLEEYEEDLEEDFDSSNYLLEEDISYSLEEYDPEIHDDYLDIVEIDSAKESLNEMYGVKYV